MNDVGYITGPNGQLVIAVYTENYVDVHTAEQVIGRVARAAMLSDGRRYLQTAWWIAVFPGLAIMIMVLATNMVGDGLRDALDPRFQNR